MEMITIDCTDCRNRGPACSDCVVSVMLGVPEGAPAVISIDEQRAMSALAGEGLLPPLRLVAG